MGEHKYKQFKTKWICGSPLVWGEEQIFASPAPSPAGVVSPNIRTSIQPEYKKLFFGGKDEGLFYNNQFKCDITEM